MGHQTHETTQMLGALLFAAYSAAWLGYKHKHKRTARVHAHEQESALSPAHLQHFLQHGYVVVPAVLSAQEVADARRGLHEVLRGVGVDAFDLDATAPNIAKLSSTAGSGGVLDVFYGSWKLKLNEHPRIFEIMSAIWAHTFATCDGVWEHPFGAFDPAKGFMYIDRVCFRVPDRVARAHGKKRKGLQRSLTPHLDCCPSDLYTPKKLVSKWRPVQMFVALTDTIQANEGGFECVAGFHHRFSEWARTRLPQTSKDGTISPAPCVGDFTPIRPVEDAEVIKAFRHIPCRAGDLVIWDWRLPHANALHNNTEAAREVVYLGFLPYIPRNEEYARRQLRSYENGEPPTDQWHNQTGLVESPPDPHVFGPLGRKLMGMESW